MIDTRLTKGGCCVAGLLATLLAVSCADDSSGGEAARSDGAGLRMALQVSVADIAADGDDLFPAVERMHELRVIVTRRGEDGREALEYNRLVRLDDEAGRWRYGYRDDSRLMFRMEEAGRRHLYLFANCEPILDETPGATPHPDPEEGAYGGSHRTEIDQRTVDAYLNALREAVYTREQLRELVTGDKPGGLPMCAEHDVEIPAADEGAAAEPVIVEAPIVRAANKITFTYVNNRPRYPIFVRNWRLVNVADKAFLLPRVDENGEGNKDLLAGYSGWIDWYQKHIAGGGHNAELEFDVPEGEIYSPFNGVSTGDTYDGVSGEAEEQGKSGEPGYEPAETVRGLKVEGRDLTEGEDGKTTDPATYYFPETRYIPSGEKAQQYGMDFDIREHSAAQAEGEDGKTHYNYRGTPYQTRLPDVTTLFRGTHVRIKATFREGSQVDLQVSIIGWSEYPPVDGHLTPDPGTPAAESD